jgi:hypothetical protein
MNLSGLHFLLTYRCTSECDHCFVWGSPSQEGVFTLGRIREVLGQAQETGTIEWVYFEGGEPFLFHPILAAAVEDAASRGFQVGVVTNGYWATEADDAVEWLRPLAGRVADLAVSTDLFHAEETVSPESRHAMAAAKRLGIPAATIVCEVPRGLEGYPSRAPGEPITGGPIMYRGRAASRLAPQVAQRPWHEFRECPHERLDDPGRVHVDPLGYVHLCQGLTMGSVFERPLPQLVAGYRPHEDPITGSLLAGGPAELVRRFDLSLPEAFADACHLCYEARRALRDQFPATLAPGQMYGEGLE